MKRAIFNVLAMTLIGAVGAAVFLGALNMVAGGAQSSASSKLLCEGAIQINQVSHSKEPEHRGSRSGEEPYPMGGGTMFRWNIWHNAPTAENTEGTIGWDIYASKGRYNPPGETFTYPTIRYKNVGDINKFCNYEEVAIIKAKKGIDAKVEAARELAKYIDAACDHGKTLKELKLVQEFKEYDESAGEAVQTYTYDYTTKFIEAKKISFNHVDGLFDPMLEPVPWKEIREQYRKKIALDMSSREEQVDWETDPLVDEIACTIDICDPGRGDGAYSDADACDGRTEISEFWINDESLGMPIRHLSSMGLCIMYEHVGGEDIVKIIKAGTDACKPDCTTSSYASTNCDAE